jgi:hypothetical protein
MNTKPALPPIQHSVCVALAADGAAATRDQYDGGWPATLAAFGASAGNSRSGKWRR